jgi:hypothetical protein
VPSGAVRRLGRAEATVDPNTGCPSLATSAPFAASQAVAVLVTVYSGDFSSGIDTVCVVASRSRSVKVAPSLTTYCRSCTHSGDVTRSAKPGPAPSSAEPGLGRGDRQDGQGTCGDR